MRALRALLATVVLVPMLAWAGWQQVTTVTLPLRDVHLADAGVVVTVSANAVTAWQVSDAGVTVINTLAGSFQGGGGFFGTSCLLGLTGLGNLTPSPGCGTLTGIGPGSWVGFRLLSSPPFAVAVSTAGSVDDLYAGPGAAVGWFDQTSVGQNFSSAPNRTLQVRQIGGIDYVAMNTGSTALHMSVDGGLTNPVPNTANWREAAPVPLNGAPAVLGVVTDGGFVLIRDYRTPALELLATPAAVTPRYVSSSGLASMATTPTGAALAPIPNPARLLETWVVRSGPDGGISGKVHCIDDRACVSSNDAGVIWLWTNDVAPTVSLVIPSYDAGQTVRIFADAGDGDGDPIFVSWDASVPLSAVAGIDDGTQIEFTAPGECTPLSIEAVVTDGLPGHERSVSTSVTPTNHGSLELSGGAPVVPAGSGALSFSAGVDGGCSSASFSWSTSDGRMGTGPNFSWTPPPTECNADGGLVTISATATWSAGLPPTSSVSTQVLVEPWGAPAAPRFDGGTQQPGTTVDWFPSGIDHQCAASPFFPGTRLEWSYDPGGAVVVGLPDRLRITAPRECVQTEVTASAYRVVIGHDAGSPSETFSVSIPADTGPLTELSITVEGDGGVVFGVLSVDAGCLEERGVAANVTVSNLGALVASQRFAADAGTWPWDLEVPGGCAGGTYDVVAELEADGGLTGARAMGSVTLPFSPVVVGAQTVTQLDVACGTGARGIVALLPEPNACAAADVQWRVSGPAVVTPSGSGESFTLQTQALDFSTVGQRLSIEWSADGGPGNADSAAYTIDLGVQPFLEVDVKSRPPLRREEEAMTLEITLSNSTSCAVDGVSVLMPLAGGSPIADSVLVDGVKRAGNVTDLGLVVDGVSVPGEGKTTLQLSVHPRLLSSPTVEPVASLNGYVISTRPPLAAPATGCGCSTADLSMLLGALLIFVRRRRA